MNLPTLAGRDAATLLSSGSPVIPTQPPQKMPPPKGGLAAVALCLIVIGIVLAGLFLNHGWSLPAIAVGLGLFLLVLGLTIVSRTFGALINEQNLMSLSRFQLVVWTIVVLAAYFSYALARIKLHAPAALDITIDSSLLALMGISTTSFIGSPLILGTKKDKEPDPTSTAKTAATSGEAVADVDNNRMGTLYSNSLVSDARLTDMFQGDEVGNTMQVDLAKVQMFYFTIIAAIAYLVLVFQALRNPGAYGANLGGLPVLSGGLVTAVGISHAGYLGSKGLDHTPLQK
jgi:hypothetical protein